MGIWFPQLSSSLYISFRTSSIVIGIIQLCFFIFFFLGSTTVRLKLARPNNLNKFNHLLGNILLEHAEVIHIFFTVTLIYGASKEKSYFVMAWILSNITQIIDNSWNILNLAVHFDVGYIIEDAIILGSDVLAGILVFIYYRNMPKLKSSTPGNGSIPLATIEQVS